MLLVEDLVLQWWDGLFLSIGWSVSKSERESEDKVKVSSAIMLPSSRLLEPRCRSDRMRIRVFASSCTFFSYRLITSLCYLASSQSRFGALTAHLDLSACQRQWTSPLISSSEMIGTLPSMIP